MPYWSPEEDAGEYEGGEEGECPPPPPEEKEMLMLIEFLVDAMLLKPEHMDLQDMDPCLLQGQTCVHLTFLHYPQMCICEKDIDPNRRTGGNYIKFNSGKSLMFALSESQLEDPPPIYLEVSADKMLPHGSVPNKLFIGKTKICLTELFKQVFEKVDEKPDKLPLSKSIKDKYQLMGLRKKCPTAEITIYIRLSCLGQNIVTEFQRGNETEPFLFRSKESQKVYQCFAKDAPEEPPSDLAPPIPGWGLSAGKNCCGDGGRGGGGGGGGASPCGVQNGSSRSQEICSSDYQHDRGPFMDDEDEYDEFGTEVHGHALTVKIQKSKKKVDFDDSDSLGKTKSTTSAKTKDLGPGDQVALQLPLSQDLCKKGKGKNKAEIYDAGSKNDGTDGEQGVDSPDKDIFVLRIGKKGEATGKGRLELELRTPKPKIERPIESPRKWDKVVQTDKEETSGKGGKKKKKK